MAANRTSKTGLLDGLFPGVSDPAVNETVNNVTPRQAQEEKTLATAKEEPVMPTQAPMQTKDVVMDIAPRKGVGRPKDPGEYQKVCIRLTKENYTKARIESGKYGGVTAYLNYLIEHAE